MYYDTQRKLAFVFPPRTGSTTFRTYLSEWGVDQKEFLHPKPSELSIDNFDKYKIYGFFRNPLDRFLSLLRYMQQGYLHTDNFLKYLDMSLSEFSKLNYDQLFDLFPKYEKFNSFYFSPQNDWLANAECLNFNDYNKELLRIARMFDVKEIKIFNYNSTENTNKLPSQLIIDFVQSYYADDYRLGRERGLLT